MKKIMNKGVALSVSKGFTLIELLIVIALLGALAIGLIGAIDPFEQLKKGTDTGTRNTVSEVQQAIIRYYALKNHMPWCDDAGVCTAPTGSSLAEAPMKGDTGALMSIVNAGELKSNFTTVQSGQLANVYIATNEDNTAAIVCYKPGSKSFQSDKNTEYTTKLGVKDVVPYACKSKGGENDCYWCVQ